MFDRVRSPAVRRGLIGLLDGLSLWVLGFLVAAYGSDTTLPWGSAAAVSQSASTFAGRWLASPIAGLPEILATLGVAIVILGAIVEWGLRPLLARRGLELRVPGAGWAKNAGRQVRDRIRR